MLDQHITERAYELNLESGAKNQIEADLLLASKVIELMNEGVASLDSNFNVTSVNPAYTKITGYTEEELIGSIPPFIATMKLSEDDSVEGMCNELENSDGWSAEFWDNTKDGTRYAASLSISSVSTDDDYEHAQYAVVLSDISKRKHDEEKIRYQANYDLLTDLPNRALFMDRLNQAVLNTTRISRKLGLMFIDLDGFKQVNDTLGHDIGDKLLKEAAKRLENCIRTGDTVARLGGDEFTVIMPNLVDSSHISIVANRILDDLSRPYIFSDTEGDVIANVSGSIGIAISPDDAETPDDLLKKADCAMYIAKNQGKNNYQLYSEGRDLRLCTD